MRSIPGGGEKEDGDRGGRELIILKLAKSMMAVDSEGDWG